MLRLLAPVKSLTLTQTARFTKLWKITKTDSTSLFFTNHDQPISYNGDTYSPTGGYDSSATAQEAGLKDRSMEVVGILSSDKITEEDLRAGLYRGAKVVCMDVDWKYPFAGPIKTNTYWISETRYSGEHWEGTMGGLALRLAQEQGTVYGRTCDRILGDPATGCTVDLSGFTHAGFSVSSIIRDRFEFYSDSDVPDNRAVFGYLVWTSGSNIGVKCEIRENDLTLGRIKLQIKTPFPIQVGDEFTLVEGCDKSFDTCDGVFGNKEEHGGYPYAPGDDSQMDTPEFT